MFIGSENEYKYLKQEASELRACITRYIGYIISVAGLSALLMEYFLEKSSPLIVLLISIAAMLIITLLFDIVWYKFKSHNRFTGYLQLLSQEVNHIPLTESILKQGKRNKNYLNINPIPNNKNTGFNQSIYSWDFVMSRLYGVKLTGSEKKLLSATDNAFFSFQIPPQYEFHYLNKRKNPINKEFEYLTLDRDFFSQIVYRLYGIKERLEWREKLIAPIKILQYVYSRIKPKPLFPRKDKIDPKYLSIGWLYPKKILQIAFIPIFLIFFNLCFFTILNYKFYWDLDGFKPENLYPPFILIIAFWILVAWFRRYLYRLPNLIYGRESIEYYCWTFFIFRVQILNSNGILPLYFSRSFIRYFKSRLILSEILGTENELSQDYIVDEKDCFSCHYNNKPKSEKKEIPKDPFRVFCKECYQQYVVSLKGCIKFQESLLEGHQVINSFIKNHYMEKYERDNTDTRDVR